MKSFKPGSESTTRIAAIILTIVTCIILVWGLKALFQPVPVVIVKNNVPTGQIIAADDLVVDKISVRDRHQEAFAAIPDVIGSGDTPGLYASTDLFPGQQLIKQQTTDNPDKLRNALAGIKMDQTVLQLTATQAQWPDILRDGDFVMIQAVYTDQDAPDDIGVGRITKNISAASSSALDKVGQAASSQQSKQYIVCSIETERKAIVAVNAAKMVYLLPLHPQLGKKGL